MMVHKGETMQIFIEYVLPNVTLFGGIYILAKYVENSVWYYIENYDSEQETLKGMLK
jgi:hypothetical protein|tara:strand:+ start:1147 stop:1317 length:171 start_codon:yes stop_codon:yes gene_type:complete